MDTTNKKKELHFLIGQADDHLTDLLIETAVAYGTQKADGFVVPDEWIEEAEERSRRLETGEDKGMTLEETKALAHNYLQERRKKEWIEETEEASRKLNSGESKGFAW
ncbi:addiction module protein [Parasediminibacterium sp. JCM 36343]|uniref:addiction module protein n=1 Tax=Parasediminibacterium sp. JCM 36343 TaxID=3374279 RepID=UPI0039785D1E